MSRDPDLGSPGSAPPTAAASGRASREVGGQPEATAAGQRAAFSDKSRGQDTETAGGASRVARQQASRAAGGPKRHRPSLGGGLPAQQRELGAQGRETVRRLLEAGLGEFDEKGFGVATVEDIVRRAKTSHGTFYLYFASKDDLFRTLLRDALHDMAIITDEFPVVTSNEAGRTALRRWVQKFGDTYAAHATVIRILSQADIVGEEAFADGLQLLFRLSEAMTQGMTAAQQARTDEDDAAPGQHAELTALACLMMLERVNYLLSAVEVQLPVDEMFDRLTAILYAAFRSS